MRDHSGVRGEFAPAAQPPRTSLVSRSAILLQKSALRQRCAHCLDQGSRTCTRIESSGSLYDEFVSLFFIIKIKRCGINFGKPVALP